MVTCPYCDSDDVDRIGLFEYQCNDCGEPFDASEIENDNEWYPNEEEDDNED